MACASAVDAFRRARTMLPADSWVLLRSPNRQHRGARRSFWPHARHWQNPAVSRGAAVEAFATVSPRPSSRQSGRALWFRAGRVPDQELVSKRLRKKRLAGYMRSDRPGHVSTRAHRQSPEKSSDSSCGSLIAGRERNLLWTRCWGLWVRVLRSFACLCTGSRASFPLIPDRLWCGVVPNGYGMSPASCFSGIHFDKTRRTSAVFLPGYRPRGHSQLAKLGLLCCLRHVPTAHVDGVIAVAVAM